MDLEEFDMISFGKLIEIILFLLRKELQKNSTERFMQDPALSFALRKMI